jgi:hypothetical protein
VALRGGLGNQLFQFSYALFVAQQGQRVNLDLSCVRDGVPAIFQVPLIGDQARHMALRVTRFMPAPWGRLTFVGQLSRQAMRPGRLILDESPQGARPPLHLPATWWFGYWQRLSYAARVIPLLKAGFAMAEPSGGAGRDRRPAVARVHVRRAAGDGYTTELSNDWYKRALDMVYADGRHPVETEVVTNDPDWCRRNLDLGRAYTLHPPGSAFEDMRSLAASDFLVISRSTLSWWAAAASEATVVAPDPWLPEVPPGGTDDLLPATWLRCPAQSC